MKVLLRRRFSAINNHVPVGHNGLHGQYVMRDVERNLYGLEIGNKYLNSVFKYF